MQPLRPTGALKRDPRPIRSRGAWLVLGACCALALAGCKALEGVDHPFQSEPPPAPIADIATSPTVMVAPVAGPPPEVGRVMAELVADSLRQRDVLAVTRNPPSGSLLLTGRSELVPQGKDHALLRVAWSLTQADGLTAGTFQSEETVPVVPGEDPYQRLAASSMVPFADRVAFKVADQVQSLPKQTQTASLAAPPGTESAAPSAAETHEPTAPSAHESPPAAETAARQASASAESSTAPASAANAPPQASEPAAPPATPNSETVASAAPAPSAEPAAANPAASPSPPAPTAAGPGTDATPASTLRPASTQAQPASDVQAHASDEQGSVSSAGAVLAGAVASGAAASAAPPAPPAAPGASAPVAPATATPASAAPEQANPLANTAPVAAAPSPTTPTHLAPVQPAVSPAPPPVSPAARAASSGMSILVAPVQGAPGDGNQMLTDAIKRMLQRYGIALTDYSTPGTLVLHGRVTIAPAANDLDDVQLEWTVYDASGRFLGTVTQRNRLTREQVEGRWAETAVLAASGAANGIRLLIAQAQAAGPAQVSSR